MAQLPLAQGNDRMRQLSQHTLRDSKHPSGSSRKRHIIKASTNFDLTRQDSVERIRQKFGKTDLSISSYDTAWVAMVPKKEISINDGQPCFPKCLDWVLRNQNSNGSWGLHSYNNSSLIKDSLSSTLACLLALQKWGVGERLITKGLDFIGSNRLAIYDKKQSNPIGFDIIFPGMISYASELGLNLPLDSHSVDLMLRNRDLHLERGKLSCLGYVAEGLGESYDWKDAMKNQRRNGSFFNSPATTAASLIHHHDDKSFNYLHSLLYLYGDAVPTAYPFYIYTRLCMVDNIEKLGIARYFSSEIKSVLDETYSCWQQRSDEIFMDVACLAMGFRLLRLNGYEVPSDSLEDFVDQEHFFDTIGLESKETYVILELYKASEITLFENEPILEKINDWTSSFLKKKLPNEHIYEERLHKKVENALEYSIDTVDRIAKRRNIELYDVDDFRMMKTSFRSSNIHSMDLLSFAVQDFNNCQIVMHEEVRQLEKWVKESRLDMFDWKILMTNYFLYSVDYYTPELSEARMLTTKICFLGTLVDDLFDVDGSTDEFLNVIESVERWDERSTLNFPSELIETVFSVLHHTIDDYATKASIAQGRCVRDEFIQLWRDLEKAMMTEVNWWKSGTTPLVDEYVRNGVVTIGTGLYLMGAYFYGSKLTPEILKSKELDTVFHHGGTIARLFNDLQGYLREGEQRKVNGYHMLIKKQGDVPTAGENAKGEMDRIIGNSRRELLRMMVQTNGSNVPREFKETFWNLSKLCHYLYTGGDQFRCPTFLLDDIKGLLYEPIPLPPSCGSEEEKDIIYTENVEYTMH